MRTRNGKKKILSADLKGLMYNPARPGCVLCVIEDEAAGFRKEWLKPENIVADERAIHQEQRAAA